MNIAERLRALRKEKGLTQDDVANALYVTRQSVCKWETGKALPDVEKLRQLCVLLEVSADELLELNADIAKKHGMTEETISNVQLEEADERTQSLSPMESDDLDDTVSADTDSPLATKSLHGKRRKLYTAMLLCLILIAAGTILWSCLVKPALPAELQEAQKNGLIDASWLRLAEDEISERSFLTLLNKAAVLRLGTACPFLQLAEQEPQGST